MSYRNNTIQKYRLKRLQRVDRIDDKRHTKVAHMYRPTRWYKRCRNTKSKIYCEIGTDNVHAPRIEKEEEKPRDIICSAVDDVLASVTEEIVLRHTGDRGLNLRYVLPTLIQGHEKSYRSDLLLARTSKRGQKYRLMPEKENKQQHCQL